MNTDRAVIIPCWNRPEMLALCLEYLREAGGEQYPYFIAVDNHVDGSFAPELMEVVRDYAPQAKVRILKAHNTHGNTHNVLSAFRDASRAFPEAERFFYVEEDILVGKDFFRWHEAVNKFDRWGASVASVNLCGSHDLTKLPDTSEGVYTSEVDYTALGSCLPGWILPMLYCHDQEFYYQNMPRYVRIAFPRSTMNDAYSEQDGLIRRVMEANRFRVAWPVRPRCAHVGYYGYHRRGVAPGATWRERLAFLKTVASHPDKLNQMAKDFPDAKGCNFEGEPWETLKLEHSF